LKDAATGEYYPVVVQKHTMSSQFVFEGLSAGFLFILGGLILVIIVCIFVKGVGTFLMGHDSSYFNLAGVITFVMAYLLGSAFFKQKMSSLCFSLVLVLFFFACRLSILNNKSCKEKWYEEV
jgi:hypothetical protein